MLKDLRDVSLFFVAKEKNKKDYVFILVVILLSKIFTIISPFILTHMLNNLRVLNTFESSVSYIGFYFISRFLSTYFLHIFDKKFVSISLNSSQNLLSEYFNYYLKDIYDVKSNGVINSQLSRYKTSIFNFFSFAIKHFLPVIVELTISIVFSLFFIGWHYSLIMLAGTVLFFIINTHWTNKQNIAIPERDRYFDLSQDVSEDLLKNKLKIYQNNQQPLEQQNFNISCNEFIEHHVYANTLQTQSEFQKNALIIFSGSLMIFFFLLEINNGQKTIADLILMLTISNQVFGSLGNTGYMFTGLLNSIPSMKNLKTVIEENDKIISNVAKDNHVENIKIVLNEFSYNPNNIKLELENITLDINSGEKIAIIGKSGSGKSLLLKSIYGLSENKESTYTGEIVWYGYDEQKNLINIERESRKNYSAFINQNPTFFKNTILYNLLYGINCSNLDSFYNENITEISKVLSITGFEKVLSKRLLTLKEIMDDKLNLSGGELQKLSLANALLNIVFGKKQIVFFDEFSSAIDRITEEKIIKEIIFDYLKNCTVISVSHNIHSLKNYDKIVVLKNGKVNDIGTHDELLAKNSFYQKSLLEHNQPKNESE